MMGKQVVVCLLLCLVLAKSLSLPPRHLLKARLHRRAVDAVTDAVRFAEVHQGFVQDLVVDGARAGVESEVSGKHFIGCLADDGASVEVHYGQTVAASTEVAMTLADEAATTIPLFSVSLDHPKFITTDRSGKYIVDPTENYDAPGPIAVIEIQTGPVKITDKANMNKALRAANLFLAVLSYFGSGARNTMSASATEKVLEVSVKRASASSTPPLPNDSELIGPASRWFLFSDVTNVFNAASKKLGVKVTLEDKYGDFDCTFVLGTISAGAMKMNYQLNVGIPLKNYGKAGGTTDFMSYFDAKYAGMRTRARKFVTDHYVTTAADTDEVAGVLTIFLMYQVEVIASGPNPKKDKFLFLPKIQLADVVHMALPDAVRTVIATKHSNNAFVDCAVADAEDLLVTLLGVSSATGAQKIQFKTDYCALFTPAQANAARYPGESATTYGTTAWRFNDTRGVYPPYSGCVSGKPLPPQRGASDAVLIVTEFRDPSKQPTASWTWTNQCTLVPSTTCPSLDAPLASVTALQ
jgi:hypothetical protein